MFKMGQMNVNVGFHDTGITDWGDKLKTGKKIGEAKNNGELVALTCQNEGAEIAIRHGDKLEVYQLEVTEKGKSIKEIDFLNGTAGVDAKLQETLKADDVVISTEDDQFLAIDDGKLVQATPLNDDRKDYDIFMQLFEHENHSPELTSFVKQNYTNVRMIDHNLKHFGMDHKIAGTKALYEQLDQILKSRSPEKAKEVLEKVGIYYPTKAKIEEAFKPFYSLD